METGILNPDALFLQQANKQVFYFQLLFQFLRFQWWKIHLYYVLTSAGVSPHPALPISPICKTDPLLLMGGWSKLVDQKSEFRVASAMLHNMTLWNPIFLLGYLQLWNIMIGGVIHPTPDKLLSKTSQIYVAGFPVMVLFLWSSTCDKHNLVIFEWGRDFSSEVSPFHFCWTNSLNRRSLGPKKLSVLFVFTTILLQKENSID